MSTEAPSRSIVRYHGGKWVLAKWIISHFPPHRIYVEPFGGAASVLLQKKRTYAEVYNDKWDVIVNIFKVLRDPVLASNLKEKIYLTPYARAEFEYCQKVDLNTIEDIVEKARIGIFRSFAGFGSASINSNHHTSFRSNSNRSGTIPAHDWNHYVDHIDSFTKRLKGVVIENRDAIDVMHCHDSDNTLHYVDPPYVALTRNLKNGNEVYAIEIDDNDHIQLIESIKKLKGRVVLSGYDNDLYSELLKDWHISKRQAFADGAKARTEVLWMNYKPSIQTEMQL